jgi:hypothetical protein
MSKLIHIYEPSLRIHITYYIVSLFFNQRTTKTVIYTQNRAGNIVHF